MNSARQITRGDLIDSWLQSRQLQLAQSEKLGIVRVPSNVTERKDYVLSPSCASRAQNRTGPLLRLPRLPEHQRSIAACQPYNLQLTTAWRLGRFSTIIYDFASAKHDDDVFEYWCNGCRMVGIDSSHTQQIEERQQNRPSGIACTVILLVKSRLVRGTMFPKSGNVMIVV